jgi:adenosylcobinamide-GDP ribazoletransferase
LLLDAIALLTRLPVRARARRPGIPLVGIVGGAIGLVAAVPLLLLGERAPFVAAALTVAAFAVASGAFHLDGLADTADALAARDPEASERARADPRIGAAGASAVVFVLAFDIAALGTLASDGRAVAVACCVVAGAGSRAAPTALALGAGHVSPGSQLGAWFVAQGSSVASAAAWAGATTIALVASALSGSGAVLTAFAVGSVLGIVVSWVVVRARGGIDGDSFGASIELTFAAVLLAAVVLT